MNTLSYVKGLSILCINACKVIHIITGMQNIALQAFLIKKLYTTLDLVFVL